MVRSMAIQVSIYVSEADKWQRRPLHTAVLQQLHAANIAGATVIRASAGFTGRGPLKTGLGGHGRRKLPLVLTFIDTEAHVREVLPRIAKMVGSRLIVRQKVQIDERL